MNDLFDIKTLERLKKLAMGGITKELNKEFVADSNGILKIGKQKEVTKLTLPDVDLLKFVYSVSQELNIKNMSDEELENEKKRLIKQLLQEEENGNRKSENEH